MLARPATRDDLREVVDLYKAFDLTTRGFVDTDDADVTGDWDAPGFDLATMTRALEDDGRVVGYAVLDAHGVGDTVVDLARPDALALTEALLTWLEQGATHVQHYLQSSDEEGAALFRRRGWTPERTFWRMRLDHDASTPLPEPRWPSGVAVRGIDPDRDARSVHEVVQTAFADSDEHHVRKSFEEWAAYLLHPDRLDRELYLVAEEDREVVGVCLGQDMVDYVYVRQLAIPRAHRGRGIAMALLHEEFRRAAARGRPATALGVDAENRTGATRLYERAGMRVAEEFTRWHHRAG